MFKNKFRRIPITVGTNVAIWTQNQIQDQILSLQTFPMDEGKCAIFFPRAARISFPLKWCFFGESEISCFSISRFINVKRSESSKSWVLHTDENKNGVEKQNFPLFFLPSYCLNILLETESCSPMRAQCIPFWICLCLFLQEPWTAWRKWRFPVAGRWRIWRSQSAGLQASQPRKNGVPVDTWELKKAGK